MSTPDSERVTTEGPIDLPDTEAYRLSMLRLVPGVVLAGLVGIAVGLCAFALTSGHEPLRGETGGLCYDMDIADPYFDLWTGQPHGLVMTCRSSPNGPWQIHGGVTEDMQGRWAVPFPAGFLVGALGTAFLLLRREPGWGSRLRDFTGKGSNNSPQRRSGDIGER